MALPTEVTHDQFVIISEMEVFHTPTGAVFHAYPYANPTHVLQSVKMTCGRAGTPIDSEYVRRVRLMASQLLLDQVCRVDRKNKLGDAA